MKTYHSSLVTSERNWIVRRFPSAQWLRLALAVILLPLTIPAVHAAAANARFVPGELIVQFRAEADETQILDAFRSGALDVKRMILTPAMLRQNHPGINVVTTRLPVAAAIDALSNHPAVAFAEPNWIYTHQAMPADPYYGYQWGLNGAYGVNAEAAWNISTGSPAVVVGVVDQGLDLNHLDLRDNIWLNPGDSTVNGINEDDNWYWYTYFFGVTVRVDLTDDLHGWDFLNQNNTIYDSVNSSTDLSDGDDHGSHVAGIIGAKGNNGIGVTGVNWDVRIVTSKFLGGGFGTLEDVIDSIDYMTALKTRSSHPTNIVAVNASWGGGGYSQALHDALIRLANAGIVFVAAAGNGGHDQVADNNDNIAFYPANYDTSQGTSTQSAASYNAVISVAAIASNGQMPSWSNYGANKVHLGAPGVSILSTVPTEMYSGGYAYFSGTSMAAPHVSGAAALYASVFPTATAAQIRDAILGSTAATTSLAGKTVTGGRLDVGQLLTTPPGGTPPPPPPSAPTSLSASAGDAQVVLDWKASADADSYKVKRASTSGGSYATLASGVTTTTYTDEAVTNGQTYYYVVSAVNEFGESGNSNEATATPEAPSPSPPTTATTMHVGSINVSVVNLGRGNKAGRAEVLVVDGNGNPVSNALVTGTFSGSIAETGVSGLTSSSGLAVIGTTDTARGGVSVSFCVTNVTHDDFAYDASANVEDCDGS